MKSIKYIFLFAVNMLFTNATVSTKESYTLAKDYSVTIHGTSNLHAWDEKVETVSGDGIINRNTDGSFDLTTLHIKMNVHSIKSDMGSIMNNNTYKALKADANPDISFALINPIASIQPTSTGKTLSAKGTLTIAGVSNPVDMQVKISMQEKGKLAFEGSQTIKMTDYNINPPTALFGTLKTGNEITIRFKTNFLITN